MRAIKNGTLILFALTIKPTPAAATTFAPRPFETSVAETATIARGTVGQIYADWVTDKNGGRRIHTFVDLAVTEVFKGLVPTKNLVFRQLGGSRDRVALEIPGSAKFTRGEDVVVFLSEQNEDKSFDLLGLMMAKFEVHTDSQGNEFLKGPANSNLEHSHVLDENRSHQETLVPLPKLRELTKTTAPTQKSSTSSTTSTPDFPTMHAGTSQERPLQDPSNQAQLGLKIEGEKSWFHQFIDTRLFLVALTVLGVWMWRRRRK